MGDISRAVGLLAVGFVVHRLGQKRGFKEGYEEGKKKGFKKGHDISLKKHFCKEKYLPSDFFKSDDQAANALTFIEATIRDKGVASVADLYRFVGKEPSPYLETVGWTDVSMASVIFDRSGPNLRIPGTHKL